MAKKTAEAITKLGYNNIIIANNSAANLLQLAKKKLDKNKGLVLYLSGQIITLDLTKKLQENGFLTKRIIVYKTKEIAEFNPKTIKEIKQKEISQIWFYSQNSVRIFYKLAKKHNLLGCLKNIEILCFSEKIALFAKEIFQEINPIKIDIIKN